MGSGEWNSTEMPCLCSLAAEWKRKQGLLDEGIERGNLQRTSEMKPSGLWTLDSVSFG